MDIYLTFCAIGGDVCVQCLGKDAEQCILCQKDSKR